MMLQQALREWEHGECPIAVPRGSKRADSSWSVWQDRRPPLATVKRMFADDVNLALVQGRANGNGLAIDADGPREFNSVFSLLYSAGVLPRIVRRPENGSDHDGGGVFALRTSLPVATEHVTLSDGLTIEARAQGSYILGPRSEHPGGGFYYDFFYPPDGVTTLHLLRSGGGYVVDGISQLQFRAADPPKARISRKAWRLLNGDSGVLARYPLADGQIDRSRAEAALCASLYRSGFDYRTVERLFQEHDCAGRYAEMYATDPDKAREWLRLTWDRVTAWCDEHESPAVTLARRLAAWADDRPWPGRTGSTDKAIYRAHCHIVHQCGRLEYAASARDLAELAGVGFKTAALASHRLVDAGLLVHSTESKASMAQRYAILNVIESLQSDTLYHPPHVMECVTTKTPHGVSHYAQDDAFRWKGLGKTGADVWRKLETVGPTGERERLTIRELSDETGRAFSTVWRKLGLLQEIGMADVDDEGRWYLTAAASTDQVAKELGTAGALAKQKRKHAMQRAAHARELERGLQEDNDARDHTD